MPYVATLGSLFNMLLEIITLALDAQPWITLHWPELVKLPFRFRWNIVEGVAANVKDTSWCSQLAPRLSKDGTTQYLDAIAACDPRIVIHRKEFWQGKTSMMNEPIRFMHEPCLLLQMDADELWTAAQLIEMREMFIQNPDKHQALFWCDYRVGRNIRITSRNSYGNNSGYEWLRAWRWSPGMFFASHEPPNMAGCPMMTLTHADTEKRGLVFRHESYSTRAQVTFKVSFYGSSNNPKGHLYRDAVEGWERLQRNRKWPVNELKEFLPWCGDGVTVDQI